MHEEHVETTRLENIYTNSSLCETSGKFCVDLLWFIPWIVTVPQKI